MFGRTKTRTPNPTMTPARSVPLVKDPNGAPAVNLAKVREAGHVDLAKRADKAGLALSKRGLGGMRAKVLLILDRSGSMGGDYRSGAVQTLTERALGFALQVSTTGSVDVVAFDSQVSPPVTVTAANYAGVIGRDIPHPAFGRTNMTGAMQVVQRYAQETDVPLICIAVADGEPDEETSTTRVICELSRYPVFVKLLAVKPVEYFRHLDDELGGKQLLDNVDAKPTEGGPDLLTCSDLEFADAMADEWDAWVAAATTAGLLV